MGTPYAPSPCRLDGIGKASKPSTCWPAAYPTPLLLMAGKYDTLFRADWSQAAAAEVARAYEAGAAEIISTSTLMNSPHDYTASQALRAIAWMDHWVREIPKRQLTPIRAEELEMAPKEVLQCHPRAEENIFSINRREAERLATLPRSRSDSHRGNEIGQALTKKDLAQLMPVSVKSVEPFTGLQDNRLDELLLVTETAYATARYDAL